MADLTNAEDLSIRIRRLERDIHAQKLQVMDKDLLISTKGQEIKRLYTEISIHHEAIALSEEHLAKLRDATPS